MLLFISAPQLHPEVSQQETLAPSVTPATPVETKRSGLSMVWRKEFDGKRERMVASWVIDAVGREC